jgi:sepiapterin reductase
MKFSILTGGSRGLGAALAGLCRDNGYKVVEFSRTGKTKDSIQLDLKDARNVSEVVRCRLRNIKENNLEEIICINNAGTLFPIGKTSHRTIDEILENINTNYASGLVFISEIIKHFQNTKCRKTVVNISSGAAVKGYSGWSLYCAAKAGIENYIRAVALEQNTYEYPVIAVNINPGIIDTDMQRMIRETDEVDFPQRQRFIDFKKNGALSTAEDAAQKIMRIVEGNIEGGKTYSV